MNQNKNLSVIPIGVLKCTKRVKFDAPHQPKDGIEDINTVELNPNFNFEQALRDLEGFDRIWLVWWFHKNTTWRPLVLPPRGSAKRRGVFATRSPHRPNPIGLTAVQIIKIEGRNIQIGNADLLDGTPILDIKPYITTIDSFSDSRNGWIDEIDKDLLKPPSYIVEKSDIADSQIKWLKEKWSIQFTDKAIELLSRDPTPHRTRRISRTSSGEFKMGCGAWRIFFTLNGNTVSIIRLATGYPQRLLYGEGYTEVPDREAQIEFIKMWSPT